MAVIIIVAGVVDAVGIVVLVVVVGAVDFGVGAVCAMLPGLLSAMAQSEFVCLS